ncbi:MAG: TetR/AcrR family transcriptional regulator [Anaerolineae bacterium]|nr:TetR/AcrR family transcriptional regulator [Anaerolineae bacterium]
MSEATPKTQSRRERRKEQTRQRLLEAAERLFRTQGFDATTVEEIAETADVAKGTFFNYFANKDSLLGDILQQRTYPLLMSPPGEGRSSPERIEALLKAFWKELFPYRHIAKRMLAHALTHPQPRPAQGQSLPAKTLARLIHEGQAQGIFRADLNVEAASILITSAFFRLFMLECDNDAGALCPETLLKETLDLIYYGMADGLRQGE